MPFAHYVARSFTAALVQREAPACCGLYGLSNAREWLYVGVADNIKATLMEHLRERNTFLADQHPTGFTFEECPSGNLIARRDCLILELEPVGNRRARPGR
jgi:hypothetical protein